jgi:cytochrome P450
MRAADPVHYDPRTDLWPITRCEHIAAAALLRRVGWVVRDALSQVDPPRHPIFRRIVEEFFTGPVARCMHAYLDEHVLELIGAFERRGTADILSEFAIPLPVDVIADQLGRPLAAAELAIAFRWLLGRIDRIRLSGSHAPPQHRAHFNLRALDSLWIEFEPRVIA